MIGIRLLLAALVLYLFADSTIRSMLLWRKFGDARSLRNLVNNLSILVGSIGLTATIWVVDYAPDNLETVLGVVIWVVLGWLLIAGLFDRWSWHKASQEERR